VKNDIKSMRNKGPIYTTLLFSSVLIGLILSSCDSQKPFDGKSLSVIAELDTTEATIGDIVTLSVTVNHSDKYRIHFPDLQDSLELEKRDRNILQIKNQSIAEFQLVPWDTGKFEIPPYTVQFIEKDNVPAFEMSTYPLELDVKSVLSNEQSRDLHPVKEPVPVSPPIPWRIITLVTLFMLLLGSAIYLWKQRIPPIIIPTQEYDSSVPPNTIAMEKLSKLKIDGDSKLFYTGLSYTLREFIENSYYLKTLEMTTKEIIECRSWVDIPENQFNEWTQLLSRADMVKYARDEVMQTQKLNDLNWSKEFVEQFKVEYSI